MTRRHPGLQLDQIQRIIVRGSTLPAADFHFFRVRQPAAARRFLGELADRVTTANRGETAGQPGTSLSVALTYRGLEALGLPPDSLGSFPAAFRAGMAGRAALIGDLDKESPDHWEHAGNHSGSAEPHVLLWLAGTRPALTAAGEELRQQAAKSGLEFSFTQEAGLLPGVGRREHFGFADGISQPRLKELERSRSWFPPWRKKPENAPVAAGEFILGHLDEERVLPPAPEPAALGRNGSFLVYRKLAQDVPCFRKLLDDHANLLPGGREEVAAKLVGRWRNGSPLMLTPEYPNAALAKANDFGYGNDMDGFLCPVGAHIRRANPRGGLPFKGALVNRHRMMRRGLPYGGELPEGSAGEDQSAGDEGGRGLIFACFVADVVRQFEFIQSHWLDGGNAFGLGSDADPIVSAGADRFMISGRPPRFIAAIPQLVTLRWGEYLFAPGIGALRWIAGLEPALETRPAVEVSHA